MNDLVRQIKDRLDRMKELVKEQKGVPVDEAKIKSHFTMLVGSTLRATLETIERVTRV